MNKLVALAVLLFPTMLSACPWSSTVSHDHLEKVTSWCYYSEYTGVCPYNSPTAVYDTDYWFRNYDINRDGVVSYLDAEQYGYFESYADECDNYNHAVPTAWEFTPEDMTTFMSISTDGYAVNKNHGFRSLQNGAVSYFPLIYWYSKDGVFYVQLLRTAYGCDLDGDTYFDAGCNTNVTAKYGKHYFDLVEWKCGQRWQVVDQIDGSRMTYSVVCDKGDNFFHLVLVPHG